MQSFYTKNASFYQDRLGTNIRKPLKKDAFPAGFTPWYFSQVASPLVPPQDVATYLPMFGQVRKRVLCAIFA